VPSANVICLTRVDCDAKCTCHHPACQSLPAQWHCTNPSGSVYGRVAVCHWQSVMAETCRAPSRSHPTPPNLAHTYARTHARIPRGHAPDMVMWNRQRLGTRSLLISLLVLAFLGFASHILLLHWLSSSSNGLASGRSIPGTTQSPPNRHLPADAYLQEAYAASQLGMDSTLDVEDEVASRTLESRESWSNIQGGLRTCSKQRAIRYPPLLQAAVGTGGIFIAAILHNSRAILPAFTSALVRASRMLGTRGCVHLTPAHSLIFCSI
jgi:hypothetical protein